MGVCGYLHPFDWWSLNLEDRRALILGLHHHGVTQGMLGKLYEYSSFCCYYFGNNYAGCDAFIFYINLSGISEQDTYHNSPADQAEEDLTPDLKPEWE